MKNVTRGWWLLLWLVAIAACTPQQTPEEKEAQQIVKYLQDQGLFADAIRTESGVYYLITDSTQGAYPDEDEILKIEYKGYFLDEAKTVFDSTNADSTGNGTRPYLEFILGRNQVIDGLDIGIRYFREGERGTLIIPSRLGYGSSGRGSIPGNTPLRFDIYLREIN
ncbi:FKBP-type peptidyl-prolyl cis-trans isomerase FkpA [Catalinimonas alkaloidigena]|uniref:Peptidyl-prolyl cis-trans isomerase n=1 Tax=Catalinimonas alkaloidigena TaxID=1075417 RepID=A0A1G9DP64_9BACT|nr:FKBP-type peptidyl-prolyl cis-trans isomerase [Catalinimonas alkaloidigena]SDK65687.1 FKBP-type peptidyl-prolyl cis-trans isomerase FkpA [Catalinimonas alkaloidigena]